MKMGRLFTPGLSGMALFLSALVLWLKGYRIQGLRSIDLPSNWISLHPGIRPKVVRSIFRRRKADTQAFLAQILDGRRVFRGLRTLPLDLLITPIGILYYIIGRFALAKTFFASRDCTRCGLCVEQCPVRAIRLVDDRCFWTHHCESCMQCMNHCPHRAIETAHGFIIGCSILIYSGILVWLNRLLDIYAYLRKLVPGAIGDQVVGLVNWFLYLLLLFLFYRIMHYLMRFRFFERLMVLTSLTRFRFWRRYRVSKKLQEI
jgi:ferredoxin